MLECGHMCTCTQCGKQMAECPICRQYVVRYFFLWRSALSVANTLSGTVTQNITTCPHAHPSLLQSCQDFQGLSWDCGRSVCPRIFSDSFLSRSTFKPVPVSRLQNDSPNTRPKYILAYGQCLVFLCCWSISLQFFRSMNCGTI